ncbi:MAG: WYL domain-containing protein [Acidimicrobiales bacterium]
MSKLERLVNLAAVLLATERPLRAEELQRRLPGYASDLVAFRRTFERDKDVLRELGIPVVTEAVGESDRAEDVGYRIPKEQYHLNDPGLDPDELAALQLAASWINLAPPELEPSPSGMQPDLSGSPGGRPAAVTPGTGRAPGLSALWKLGTGPLDSVGSPIEARAELPAPRGLTECFEGVATRRQVRFVYGGHQRRVEPWRLSFRVGRWYLSGLDQGRGEPRLFRLDRLESEVELSGTPGAFEIPSPLANASLVPWEMGQEDPVGALLLVDADQAAWAVGRVGPDSVVRWRPDGSVELSIRVTNTDAFRSFVLGLLDHAEILDPPDLRAGMVDWLQAVAAAQPAPTQPAPTQPAPTQPAPTQPAPTQPAPTQPAPTQPAPLESPGRSPRPGRTKTAKLGADGRLSRLLAIVPWVVARDGPRLEEVCMRFGLSKSELVADLDLLFLCGLPPYTPDVLIDVDISDGRVWIRLAEYFSRPLRLTPAEALALLAAGQAAMATPGADGGGALARGLAKLGQVVSVDPGKTLDVAMEPVDGQVMATVLGAQALSEQVEIDYYSAGRDQWSRRCIDPYDVFAAAGAWYVTGWCHQAVAERQFRVDRIRHARLTGNRFEPPANRPEQAIYRPRPQDPRVTLAISAEARWVIEQYPTQEWTQGEDGGYRVVLAVSSPAWLERLLLRLGPAATVVQGDHLAASRGAARVLARYR